MKVKRAVVSVVVAQMWLAGAALAQEAGPAPGGAPGTTAPPEGAPAEGAPAEVAASSSQDVGQARDPHIDRAVILPTGQTQPAGSWSFYDYELLLTGLSYGVTDNVQIGVHTIVPVTSLDEFFYASGSAKWRLVSAGRVRLSAVGSLHYFRIDDPFNDDGTGDVTIGTLGGALSLCLDEGCESLASATVQTGFLVDEDDGGYAPFIYGGSVVARISRRVKLLGEVASAGVYGDGEWFGAEGALVSYGARFHTDDIAGDLTLVNPQPRGDGEEGWPLGFPFVVFTYRWM